MGIASTNSRGFQFIGNQPKGPAVFVELPLPNLLNGIVWVSSNRSLVAAIVVKE